MSTIARDFVEWINSQDGKVIMAEAAKRALLLRERGFRSYGLKAIIEAIRYDYSVSLTGDGHFRVNDKYTSLLARRIMADFEELRGFFPVRELRSAGGAECA